MGTTWSDPWSSVVPDLLGAFLVLVVLELIVAMVYEALFGARDED
ncbi:hypothetical protein [Humibacter sp.]|nr:hypothetical protein [Humibacter sp.]HVX09204.1 hypothetical protein [Humibacter sp.]